MIVAEYTPAEQAREREQLLARELGTDVATARQILANQQVADTRILQKINRAHREAFIEKFPGQIEHCLRLVVERLQLGLDKRGTVDLNRVETWILTPNEIQALAAAARDLASIRQQYPDNRDR